jgi:sec-independent protein translocase protein TatB
MIDFGFDKLALIGAVALIVIGPEKLPKVARTVGHLVGKAQRYVADVRAEVNRSIELDELKKMKSQFEDAARNVEQTVHSTVSEASSSFDKEWSSIGSALDGSDSTAGSASEPLPTPPPEYKHPGKKWRLKRGAMPQWYRQRHGIRAKAQSGAARVARFRPAGVKAPR